MTYFVAHINTHGQRIAVQQPGTEMSNLQVVIASTKSIRIVSGEGEQGAAEQYTGRRTLRAVQSKIAREARDGRWARAEYVRMTDVDGTDHWDRLL